MTNKQIIINGKECRYWFRPTPADYRKCSLRGKNDNCDEIKDCFVKELLGKLALKEQECEELKQYKSLFEKTRNLWNESRMNNYKLLDEIKDLKDSLKRTICQSECYKHKEADKLKQTLTEIKEIAERNHKTKEELFKIRHSRLTKFSMGALNGRHNLASEILQKISDLEV